MTATNNLTPYMPLTATSVAYLLSRKALLGRQSVNLVLHPRVEKICKLLNRVVVNYDTDRGMMIMWTHIKRSDNKYIDKIRNLLTHIIVQVVQIPVIDVLK